MRDMRSAVYSPNTARAVAIHEAGHAVAACVLGIPFSRVDVIARHGRDGAFHGRHAAFDRMGEVELLRCCAEAMAALQVALAGEVAERLRGCEPVGHGSDLPKAARLAIRLSEALEVRPRPVLADARERVESLLRRHWRAVEQVAAELVRCRVLEAAEVRWFVDGWEREAG